MRGTFPARVPRYDPWLHRQLAHALQFLARELAGAADGFRPLPRFPLRGLLVMAAELHLAENALTLHLLLQHPERLIDIVVADENLHSHYLSAVERLKKPRRRGGPIRICCSLLALFWRQSRCLCRPIR